MKLITLTLAFLLAGMSYANSTIELKEQKYLKNDKLESLTKAMQASIKSTLFGFCGSVRRVYFGGSSLAQSYGDIGEQPNYMLLASQLLSNDEIESLTLNVGYASRDGSYFKKHLFEALQPKGTELTNKKDELEAEKLANVSHVRLIGF